MKITLYELRNLSNGKPEGYAAGLNGEMLPDVNPTPEAALQVAEGHAFGQMPREEDVAGEPVDGVATVGPLVTGSGPCHGEHCRHVSHVDHRRELGRTAHDAYARAAGYPPGVSFDRLSPAEADVWIAAAAAVADIVRP